MPSATAFFGTAPAFCAAEGRFSHTPYDAERGGFVSWACAPSPAGVRRLGHTIHHQLEGFVAFVRFPDAAEVAAVAMATAGAPPGGQPQQQRAWAKLFVGQLPLGMPCEKLVWMLAQMGVAAAWLGGARPLTKARRGDGVRQPTGCAHVFVAPEAIDVLAQNVHKRVLVDTTGFWYAADAAQSAALASYLEHIRVNKPVRVSSYPCDSVVVQVAAPPAPTPAQRPPPQQQPGLQARAAQ
jgi:hypothetical protein